MEPNLIFRDTVHPEDAAAVRDIVLSTGFFNAAEVGIAVELVEDRLARGPKSSYRFLFAEEGGTVLGYSCWGHIDGTESSFDLYWIAVLARARGRGLGKLIMAETERRIAAAGGSRIYAETSSRAQYAPTRAFYERCGFRAEAVLADFYAPGDSKVIYVRVL